MRYSALWIAAFPAAVPVYPQNFTGVISAVAYFATKVMRLEF